jgi:tetratricopeptide (TPR) repeat protein
MSKLIFIITLIAFQGLECFAQGEEKFISNQTLLIDAIREEQIGKREKAIEILEKLKYEPEFKGVSNFYLAKFYRASGKMDEAFEAIDQSIFNEPDNTWYLIMKTNMTEEYARDLETAQTYEKLCTLEPDNFAHYDNAAYYYLKAEDYKKSLEILNKAEKVFGVMPVLAIKKSYLFTILKKNKNAIEVLQTASKQFPSNKELLIELVRSLSESNDAELSVKYAEKLKQLDPDNEELHQWLVTQTGKISEIQNTKERDILQIPDASLDDKIKYLFLKLNTYVNKDDKTGIQSLLQPAEQLRKQFSSDPRTIALIADIYFQTNDLLNAKRSYEQAIRDGQVPYAVWDNLLFCLIHLNHWKTAAIYSNQCMDLYPNQSFPHYVNILSKYKLNQLEDIQNELDQLELIVDHNEHKKTELLILKAKILSALKKEEASAETWKSALNTDRDFLASLEYCVFMASKGTVFSKELFEKAMNSQYIHESFKLDKAAEIYYLTKDYPKAKQYIESSISKGYCESTDTILLAARIYAALGDSKTADELNHRAALLLESESDTQVKQN